MAIAEVQRRRLAAESADALVQTLAADIIECKAELDSMSSDDEDRPASQAELTDLKEQRTHAKKQRREVLRAAVPAIIPAAGVPAAAAHAAATPAEAVAR